MKHHTSSPTLRTRSSLENSMLHIPQKILSLRKNPKGAENTKFYMVLGQFNHVWPDLAIDKLILRVFGPILA